MSDPNVESGSEGNGSADRPSPEFQSQQNDQPTSPQSGQDLTDTVKKALKELGYDDIETRIERGIQSTKDRRFAQQEKLAGRVDSLESQLERYRALTGEGKMSHEDALFRMRVEQYMEGQGQQPTGNTDQPQFGQPRDWWVQAQSELLKSAGVPENDPAVAQFARSKQFSSPQQYLTELAGFIGQRLKGSGTGGALNMGGQGATPLGAGQNEQLRTQYLERLKAIPRGRHLDIANLKREFRAKGYDPNEDQALQPS